MASVSKAIKIGVVSLILADLFKNFTKFDAFKLGIIDKKGKQLRKPDRKNKNEKQAYGLYYRFVFKLKQHFGGIAGLMILLPLVLLSEEEIKDNLEELEDFEEIMEILNHD